MVAHNVMAVDPQRPRPVHLSVSASPGKVLCERKGMSSGLQTWNCSTWPTDGHESCQGCRTGSLSRLSHVRNYRPHLHATPCFHLSDPVDLVVTTVPFSRRSFALGALSIPRHRHIDVVVALSNASGSEVRDIVQSMGKKCAYCVKSFEAARFDLSHCNV